MRNFPSCPILFADISNQNGYSKPLNNSLSPTSVSVNNTLCSAVISLQWPTGRYAINLISGYLLSTIDAWLQQENRFRLLSKLLSWRRILMNPPQEVSKRKKKADNIRDDGIGEESINYPIIFFRISCVNLIPHVRCSLQICLILIDILNCCLTLLTIAQHSLPPLYHCRKQL